MLERQKLVYACDAVRFARECLDIEPDAQQALVLQQGVSRGMLNCTRQWGKSTITALKAVHRAYFDASSLVIVVSPSGRQSAEFVRKASTFLRKLGVRPRGDGDNEISLLFPNGSRIVGLPGVEATVRGFSAVSLMLVDEASRVTDEQYRAVRPMLAVGRGEQWLLSTPNGKRGFFYEQWTQGGPMWQRVRVPATECSRIPAEFLEEERVQLGDAYFRQEYMCEFVQADDSLFDTDAVRKCFAEEIVPLF